ncbi:MoaD/ThiS family protein [Chloroflexota bacterium]
MGKVQLKIPSWVAIMLNEQGSDWFILEKEIGEGATIGDLLADLASDYTDFRKVLFNPDIGKVSDQVNVILNNNLLQSTDMTEAKLNDGDTVTLLPVYTGG